MRYVGGKYRIRRELAAYLESRRDGRLFIEPFCGGANITSEMSGVRVASDICEDVIELWKAVARGWEPPMTVTENEYRLAQISPPSAYRGFVAFGCSFGGKYFGGYARSAGRNYAMNARNAILRKAPKLRDVAFRCCSYKALSPKDCLVYCDPPYADTTQGYAKSSFDTVVFWNTMRQWAAEGNVVLVSEYRAPDFAKQVWSMPTKTDMHCKGGKETRIERLYEVCN